MFSTFKKLLLVLFLSSLAVVFGGGGEGSGDIETTSEAAACGLSDLNAIVGSSASLHSPNYPRTLPANDECWWTITAPVGHHVLIKFTYLDLYVDLFVRLYDAPSQAKASQPYATISSERERNALPSYRGKFWLESIPDVHLRSILSDSNYVTMKYTPDRITKLGKFELTYRAISITIPCPVLPTLSNGGRYYSLGSNNTILSRFSCHIDFKLSGSEQRRCNSNGSWTGQLAACEKKACPNIAALDHGTVRCTDGNFVGSSCKFTCNEGYKLFGSMSRMCSISLQWYGFDTSCPDSPPAPTCDVHPTSICDGYNNCPDRSDEKGCTCPQYKVECDCYETGCQLKRGCVDQSWRCDGKNDCGDMSDERDCSCSDTGFQCKDGDCIDRTRVNDGKNDCMNGDDEFACNITQGHVNCDCVHDDDRCTSSGRCIPNTWIGDTILDCENQSYEPCNTSKVWCHECWVVINQCSTNESKTALLRHSSENTTQCHSVTMPTGQKQISETNWICTTSLCGKCLDVFQCESGQYIDNEHYCDTILQCNDGSDEYKEQFGFRCSGKSRTSHCVLPQKNIYDSMAHCSDDSDLCFVNGEFRCFSCLDGKLIVSANQVCDGIVDCYDMSDECLCANQSVCDAVMGEEMSRCSSSQMHCHNDTDCVDLNKVLCNSSVDCMDGRNRKFCHEMPRSDGMIRCTFLDKNYIQSPVNAALCDGRPECSEMEDECQCEAPPSFCKSACAKWYMSDGLAIGICDGYIPLGSSYGKIFEKNCPMRFECKSKDMISIDKQLVCDGIFDCDDHSDENNTDCLDKRFYCTKGNAFSIDKAFVCDGIKDCDNGEDETRQLCENNRFYCESGQPISIEKSSVENGIKDCSEGSDECISLFSDRYEMIANPILRALFWIMGLLALIGNMLIGINTAKDVFSCNSNNLIKLANDVFILNLAVSDFLMGVYLIAVVTQGVRYSGDYCLVDKEWRSSNLCSRLATLAVLSSETSAFIMAAMSTIRLVTVYRPFLSSSIKIKWIVITGFVCWILSAILAIFPRFPFNSGYFISDVWFPNMFLKTDTVSKPDMFTLAKRVSGNNSGIKSWFKVKEIISNVFKYTLIKGEFGYYSETSVCMPRFYASTSEAAWQYSCFLISLNFVLFIYMVIAYLLVYKKASGMKQSRSTKKDPNKGMQKRISRLLLTDFCCWIPVCVMGYLSVAGVSLPPNAYIVSAGFLLPINSAMNPILYSKFIGRQASRAKKWIIQKLSCICSPPADEADVVERRNARTQNTELVVIEMNV